jgi:hypothetical protein
LGVRCVVFLVHIVFSFFCGVVCNQFRHCWIPLVAISTKKTVWSSTKGIWPSAVRDRGRACNICFWECQKLNLHFYPSLRVVLAVGRLIMGPKIGCCFYHSIKILRCIFNPPSLSRRTALSRRRLVYCYPAFVLHVRGSLGWEPIIRCSSWLY